MANFQQCMRKSKLGPDAPTPANVDAPPGMLPEGVAPSQHVGPRSVSSGL